MATKKLDRVFAEAYHDAERIVRVCQRYSWFVRENGQIRNLPNPEITYPADYQFESPVVFAANQLMIANKRPAFSPALWEEPAAALGISREAAFMILFAADWDGSPSVYYDKYKHEYWRKEIRELLCTLL